MTAFLRKYGIAILSGVLLAWSFPALKIYPLSWVALSILFIRVAPLGTADTVRQFVAASHSFHTFLLYWMLTNTYWAGGWAVVGQQLLCVYLDLYWAAFALAWSFIRSRVQPWLLPACAAFLWTGMEYVQSFLFTGFGWSALAYSQGPNLFAAQWASVGGAPMITLFIIVVNVGCALAATSKGVARIGHVLAAVVVLLVVHLGGRALLAPADYNSKPFTVGIFQSNFSLEMKWDREYWTEMVRSAVVKSRLLADRHQTDLVVWPEALVMDDIEDPVISGMISELAMESRTAVFGGGHRAESNPYRSFNSSFLIDSSGTMIGTYDKIHLAPYGEYVPLSDFLPFVSQVVPAIGNLVHGDEVKVFNVGGRRIGPLICFEVLFAPMSERLREEGADFLTVVTNLAWFGMSNAIPQELEIARLRAIETRLPLVHSANSGISGVFDPYGRFSMMDEAIDSEGMYRELIDGLIPEDTIRERLVGAFELAAPADRPIKDGPVWFPRIAAGVAVFILLAAATRQSRKPS